MRSRLVDVLDDTWCRVGTLDLVVGVDLAVRTLSAAALENFLLGRIDRQFVRTRSEVADRMARLPRHLAIDGRYPMNELHCLPDVWPHVVSTLAEAADVVLMDLRGFQSTNQGVMYELTLIMQRVQMGRIVLLSDAETDERALSGALERSWSQLPVDSPNVAPCEARLEILRCSGVRSTDTHAILTRLFAAGFAKAAA